MRAIIDINGEPIFDGEFDGIGLLDSELCIEEDCYNAAYGDEYCSTHDGYDYSWLYD